ncbi:unnamed protein product [Arabidopsis lyrata]|uniref:Predicted protein n=1 Tax=Arabidopsis lyrata subsp. lyrata TaxID=81972 RepID=D7LSL7_ARALL|nr:predicted protein [Arabidopsis lyrata subsp. lyrata]CAH8268038.1 unnamed protein product [Arabidopsis lyrata]
MSPLRRIIRNATVSKAVPVAKAFKPYPLGRDPSSLPKLKWVSISETDNRSISLRYRVTAMIEMSLLDKAANLSRLAVMDDFRVDRDTHTATNVTSTTLLSSTATFCSTDVYMLLTKALVDAERFDEACDLVSSMSSCSFMVYDILIRGFLDVGNFVKASQIFEELKGLDSKLPGREYHTAIAIFNVSFMNYFFNQGKDEEAMEILATLEEAQVLKPIVGNRVLDVLVWHGKDTEAWELFEEMIEICDSETIDIMSDYFSEKTVPFERLRKTCYRNMIVSLCEHEKVSDAEKLFAEMFTDVDVEDLFVGPDVLTFRAMINGYVKVGRFDDAIMTLNKMRVLYIRKLAIHHAP